MGDRASVVIVGMFFSCLVDGQGQGGVRDAAVTGVRVRVR